MIKTTLLAILFVYNLVGGITHIGGAQLLATCLFDSQKRAKIIKNAYFCNR